jgi:threonine dehydrogenase-like Zn-dependent dehydrogenase
MKAVHIVGYERAVYTDVPVPEPGPDELLVRVKRVGVCHSDVEVFRQELGIYRAGGASLPIIPGHEWAGEVVQVGAKVKGFEVGERVTGECGIGCGQCWLCQQGLHNICPDRVETGVFNRNGAYAEYLCVPYTHAHHLYDLSFQEGALVEPCTVGLWIARRANIGPGDRVAIIGSGSVGLMATQMARVVGADLVVTVGRSAFKLDLAREMGAHAVINLVEEPLAQVAEELTRGRGFNVVIEATGVPEGATLSLRTAAPRARVVITGVFEGELQAIDLNTIMPKELTVLGSLGGPTVFDQAIDLIRQGKLKVLPINTHTLPLSMGPQALAMVAQGRPDLVKIHLDCEGTL